MAYSRRINIRSGSTADLFNRRKDGPLRLPKADIGIEVSDFVILRSAFRTVADIILWLGLFGTTLSPPAPFNIVNPAGEPNTTRIMLWLSLEREINELPPAHSLKLASNRPNMVLCECPMLPGTSMYGLPVSSETIICKDVFIVFSSISRGSTTFVTVTLTCYTNAIARKRYWS